jgi:hypothetical protein
MHIFKVVFLNQGKVYEIYAKTVRQGDLYGFVEIEDLIFEQSTSLVVDPSAEKLREEFSGVHRTRVPIHAVIRIDGKITEIDANSNITPFPNPFIRPDKSKD